MEKIIDERKNKIIGRDEIKIRIEHPKGRTPSRKEIIEKAEKMISTKRDLFVIRKIQTIYGEPASIVTIHRYKDRKDLEANEPKHIIKRNTIEEKKEEEAENNG